MIEQNKLSICFFESSPPFGDRLGGIPTYILHRAHTLSKHNFIDYWTDGFKVALFDSELKDWKIIKEFKLSELKKRIISRIHKFLPGIKFLLDDVKIDIIEFPDSYSYKIKPLKEKCKVVIQCHTSSPVREFLNDLKPGIRSKLNARRIRKNLLNADKLLACSYEIALLTSGYYRIHLDNFNVIHHAFERKLFDESVENNSKKENYFIAVANVEYFQGIDLLLNAFKEYKKRGGKNKLYYVGPKNLFETVSMNKKWLYLGTDKLIMHLDKGDFEFVPYLKKNGVLDLMSKASATIVLSRFEAFTMVVGEAASVRCPLIVSNRTGWNNLINKFDGGMLVNPYNKEEVVNAMFEMENQKTQLQYSKGIKRLFNFISSDSLISATVKEYSII